MIDFIYISIPRTGTNSIHSVVPQHIDENHKSINKIDRKGFSFGFVRNPFDLVVSWYQYHRQHQLQKPYDMEFLNWVDAGCPTHWNDDFIKSRGITHPLNQFEYLCNEEGEIAVDFIGRFENLQNDFISVCNVIGIKNKSLPHENNSIHNEWGGYYTPKAMEKIKTQFKKDFELFNY